MLASSNARIASINKFLSCRLCSGIVTSFSPGPVGQLKYQRKLTVSCTYTVWADTVYRPINMVAQVSVVATLLHDGLMLVKEYTYTDGLVFLEEYTYTNVAVATG